MGYQKTPIKQEQGFIELEHAFGSYRAYRSYRVNGRSRMDVDTFLAISGKNSLALIN